MIRTGSGIDLAKTTEEVIFEFLNDSLILNIQRKKFFFFPGGNKGMKKDLREENLEQRFLIWHPKIPYMVSKFDCKTTYFH